MTVEKVGDQKSNKPKRYLGEFNTKTQKLFRLVDPALFLLDPCHPRFNFHIQFRPNPSIRRLCAGLGKRGLKLAVRLGTGLFTLPHRSDGLPV